MTQKSPKKTENTELLEHWFPMELFLTSIDFGQVETQSKASPTTGHLSDHCRFSDALWVNARCPFPHLQKGSSFNLKYFQET